MPSGLLEAGYKIIRMLKFLEERESNIQPKQCYNSKPSIGFGISVQTPTNFHNEYSMVSPLSYRSPFIDVRRTNESSHDVPSQSSRSNYGEVRCIHKANPMQIEESKVIGNGELSSLPGRYHESYHSEFSKDQSRFRLTKGEFTNYIESVRVSNPAFGPLVGEERSADKSLETKRSIIKKSHFHLEKSRDELEVEKTLRKESSRMLEKIIDESRSVRHKRDQFYLSYRQEQTERKSPKRSQIILPRVLVNREARPSPKHRNFGIFKTLDNSMLSKFIK